MVIFFQLKSSVRKFFTMIKDTNIPERKTGTLSATYRYLVFIYNSPV